jgi:prophage regulatory protein
MPPRSPITTAPADGAERLIREPECRLITGLSRQTRWRMERHGEFPRRRRISPGCSAWLYSEIATWLRARAVAVAAE